MTRIGIASDHGGFDTKKWAINYIQDLYALEVTDFGTHTPESVDYPDIVTPLIHAIQNKTIDQGILICGSGIGVSIAANRYPKIRAALCHNAKEASLSRAHNDANIVALSGRMTPTYHLIGIIESFLTTKFEGGRHSRRIEKIEKDCI